MGALGRTLGAGFTVLALLAAPGPSPAEEWGGITPGETLLEQVRARYGAPSRETRVKVEGYDTVQWVYESDRAPEGLQRMTVDFGLLTPQGYKPSTVRVMRLEPKSKIFGRNTVIQAWGLPDGGSTEGDQEVFFYRSGLIVTFEKEGPFAVLLTFTPPQPELPAPAAPRR